MTHIDVYNLVTPEQMHSIRTLRGLSGTDQCVVQASGLDPDFELVVMHTFAHHSSKTN